MDSSSPPLEIETPSPRQEQELLAPLWHTLLLVVVVLAVSLTGSTAARPDYSASKLSLYIWNIGWQLLVVGYVVLGLKLRKKTLRNLIGGRWASFEAFLFDVAIAAMFWLVSISVLAVLRFLMGVLPRASEIGELKRTLGFLIPRTNEELVLWLAMSLTAGFCEEVIFRGYLQQQFGILTRSAWVGIIASGIVFGAGHGYQGVRMMVIIAVYGMMFGVLAHYRRSLRPGMIAHAWQDALAGVVGRLAFK